jgi:hypothetical protein
MNISREKKKLKTQSDLYKDEFEKELKLVKYQTNELIKNTLIIGGSLALTYILFRQITAGKKRKKRMASNAVITNVERSQPEDLTLIEQPSRFATIASEIGTTIANEATFFLLNLAKEKLMELLASKESTQSDDDHS